jgi:hypothetical protein
MATIAEKYEGKDITLIDAAVQAGKLDPNSKSKEAVYMRQQLQDLMRVDIDDDLISQALEYPDSFGYSGGNEEMFVTWSLGGVYRTRDSDLREQSNADALEKALEEAVEDGLFSSDDYETTSCNHWAVGWVDHMSFRAIVSEETREPTLIFMWLKRWNDALEGYPVADEEDLSRREWEYAEESLDDMGLNLRDELPDDWKCQVLGMMNEIPSEHYWNEDEAKHIAHKLGFLVCDECDGEGCDQCVPMAGSVDKNQMELTWD